MATDESITAERAQRWHEDRRRGIGGSDMADLFNIEGSFGGCRRRLWYDKSGMAPDIAPVQTDQMLRGKMLETAAAEQYALDTGRKLLRQSRGRVHPEFPFLRVNVDRAIAPVLEHGPGRGCLEIKTQNGWMFRRTKAAGLSEGYLLQLQHALLVTGASWGAFMVLHPDSWRRAHWDVEADPVLQQAIIDRGREFWPTVGTGPLPEMLPATDVRCISCPWRVTCQGAERLLEAAGLRDVDAKEPLERDEAFTELLIDYADAKQAAAEVEQLAERIKASIKQQLGDRQGVACAAGRIYYRPQTAQVLDTATLKANEPELYQRYSKPRETRPLRVYAIQGRNDG